MKVVSFGIALGFFYVVYCPYCTVLYCTVLSKYVSNKFDVMESCQSDVGVDIDDTAFRVQYCIRVHCTSIEYFQYGNRSVPYSSDWIDCYIKTFMILSLFIVHRDCIVSGAMF